MNGQFVVLHLSDAHIGNPKYSLDSLDVLEPLFEDINVTSQRFSLSPNLIVFSGDLAYGEISGRPLADQYKQAKEFLDKVLAALNSSYEEIPVLIVPGNHDLNRLKVDPTQTKWLAGLKSEADAEEVYSMMQENNIQWKRMIERQQEWVNFVSLIKHPSLQFDNSLNIASGTIEHGNVKIGVVGLNSSWAASSEQDKNQLWIGKYQLQRALEKISESDFKIAVAHHPTSWLNSLEESYIEQRIESDFNVFLHGHDHSAWYRDSSRHLMVAAGACYQGSVKQNAYSWIPIDFSKRQAQIILRTYSNQGARGWIPFVIPEKTNENGVANIQNLFPKDGTATKDEIDNDVHYSSGRAEQLQSQPVSLASLESVSRFISQLENRFYFRWEPSSFVHSENSKVVYWPVRLRPPTPIHAVQCFAAAGLQKLGARIILWLDDLGTLDHPPDEFLKIVKRWFTRAGGDESILEMRKFTEVLEDDKAPYIWTLVQKWLGTSSYRLDQVLKVSKLWPPDGDAKQALEQLSSRKPRRLLTPAMVWACLLFLHEEDRSQPIITLGGYDERPLWKAWRDCAGVPSLSVGHLYVPELQVTSNQGEKPLHMGDINFAWESKEDIRSALEEELTSFDNSIGWPNPNRMIPWCFQGCVLLPCSIKGETCAVHVNGVEINSVEQLKGEDASRLIPELVEALAKWLL